MMRNLIAIVLLALIAANAAADDSAVRVMMNTGHYFDGTIKYENDDLILLVTADGNRYQLQKSAIQSISEPPTAEVSAEQAEPKSSFRTQIGFGIGSAQTTHNSRTNVNVTLIMGAADLAGGRLFVGGGIGYSGAEKKNACWHFLPLFVHGQYTFLPTKRHSPLAAMSAGYGIGLGNGIYGGAMGEIALMYRYTINRRNAIGLGAYFSAQGYRAEETVDIDDRQYTGKQNGAIYNVGFRLAITM